MRRTARLAIAVAALLAVGGPARAGVARPAGLALPLVAGEREPELILAQRVIERSWGPSADSIYVETDVPDWRSEGIAVSLSAAVPGLGQTYVGDRRGLWFALAEVSGWIARHLYRDRGEELRARAERYVGSPEDPGSAWSFARWAESGGDPAELRRLFAADPEAFYDVIATDPRYAGGWSFADARAAFAEMRGHADARFRYARYVGFGLWLNHLAAAADALRAARLHNLPLRPNLDLKLKSDLGRGGVTLSAAIERRF